MGDAYFVETNSTAAPLEMTFNLLNVGGVQGATVTVAIRLIDSSSPPYYLDWISMTFKQAGWATKYQPMTDIERGHYQQLLDVATLALIAGQALNAEYHAVDPMTGFVADGADLLLITNQYQEINYLRKVAKNRLWEAPGNPGTLVLYDDDGVTPLTTWQLLDDQGGPVLPGIGTPGRRSAGTP